MPQRVPRDVAAHYERVQTYQEDALTETLRAWREVSPDRISESWERVLPHAAAAVTSAQVSAAESALISNADMAVDTGQYELPDAFVDPESVAGMSSTGGDIEAALYTPAIKAKQAITGGMLAPAAVRETRKEFDRLVRSLVSDAGRQAATADMATRFTGGYVRMLNPPSCKRCVPLAGRWYRWNDGFLRHPRCDCVHIPAKSRQWAEDEGWIADPYEYFEGLDKDGQDRLLGPGAAQAVRDGGDIYQVINATTARRRGGSPVSADGMTTTASTSRRRGITKGRERLTPDGIYARAGGDRAKALRMLEEHGYILPGGQDPEGVLRGSREGWGALGRGGTRVGARAEIERARATGIRHPSSRYTMTEAERRRFDAGLSWDAVREGRNPYGRGPLTNEDRRRAEYAYQKYVLGMFGGDPALPRR